MDLQLLQLMEEEDMMAVRIEMIIRIITLLLLIEEAEVCNYYTTPNIPQTIS